MASGIRQPRKGAPNAGPGPDKCLILMPADWHEMMNFSKDAILMVLASEHFDAADYIRERYK
jgi:hypothetical protein